MLNYLRLFIPPEILNGDFENDLQNSHASVIKKSFQITLNSWIVPKKGGVKGNFSLG